MTKRLGVAVLAAIALDVLITGYGAIAAGQEAHVACSQDQGIIRNHECVKNGEDLFHVPL